MNKAAVNILLHFFFCGHKFSTPLGKYQPLQLLNHLEEHIYFHNKPPNCLLKWLYHFVFPPAMNSLQQCCFTSLSVFGISVSDFDHSNRCGMISHCCFLKICISLVIYDVQYLFRCLYPTCLSSLVGYMLTSLAHIFI